MNDSGENRLDYHAGGGGHPGCIERYAGWRCRARPLWPEGAKSPDRTGSEPAMRRMPCLLSAKKAEKDSPVHGFVSLLEHQHNEI